MRWRVARLTSPVRFPTTRDAAGFIEPTESFRVDPRDKFSIAGIQGKRSIEIAFVGRSCDFEVLVRL
jgi:hypothetical protein